MISILKNILKGIFYVLFFPLGLIVIALYAIFGIGVFIYRFIKLIYLFFTGRNLKTELKEDIEIKKILDSKVAEVDKPVEPALNLYPSDSEIYKVDYVSPTFEEPKQEKQIEKESEIEIKEEKIDE